MMNDENKRITKFPICQFYIVLGNHDREFKSNKENKFFSIRGNEDIKLIQYAVTEEYKKKKKEGYAVAGEIIFLVPDVKYKDLAFKLMEILNFKGRVKVVPPLKKEEPKPTPPKSVEKQVEEVKESVTKKEITPPPVQPKELPPKEEVVTTVQQEKIVSIPKKEEKIAPPPPTKKLENTTDIETYMWGDTELETKKSKSKQSKSKQKIKTRNKKIEKITLNKPKKSAIFIDLPVIVFILSALLLIGAVVLLFIWK